MNVEHYPGSPGSITPRTAGHIQLGSFLICNNRCNQLLQSSYFFSRSHSPPFLVFLQQRSSTYSDPLALGIAANQRRQEVPSKDRCCHRRGILVEWKQLRLINPGCSRTVNMVDANHCSLKARFTSFPLLPRFFFFAFFLYVPHMVQLMMIVLKSGSTDRFHEDQGVCPLQI